MSAPHQHVLQDLGGRSDWRGRVLLFLSGAVVLIVLAHVYFSQRHVETSIVEQFQRHQLEVARSAAGRIDERLAHVVRDLVRLSKEPEIVSRDAAGYGPALKRVFEELEGTVQGVYRLDAQGSILARHPILAERVGSSVPEKELFKDALAREKPSLLGPLPSLASEHILSVVVPIFHGDKVVGAVRALVNLRALAEEFIIPTKVTENSYALLIDGEGSIISHPRREYIGKTLADVGEEGLSQGFARAEEGRFLYKVAASDEMELIAFSAVKIGGRKLVLATATPRRDIAGPIKKYKRRTAGFAAILLLLVALGTLKYSEARSRRISLERERRHLLRESELASEVRFTKAYLSTLMESSPDAIISTDQNGHITFFSPGAEALLGYRQEEAIGLYVVDVYESEDRAKEVMRLMREGGGTVSAFETTLRAKDGSLIPVLISASLLYDEEGEEAGTAGFNKDLRQHKRAEEEVKLLQTLTQAISEAGDLHQALSLALRRVCEATGWVYGEAWIPHHDGSRLESSPAWWSPSDELKRFRTPSEGAAFARGAGLPGRAWASKRHVWFKDASREPDFRRAELASAVGLKTGMAVPVTAGDEVVAVMCFFAFEPREEDERFLSLVSAVVAQLGSVIQRRIAEEALGASEESARLIVEHALDAVITMDSHGLIRGWNPQAEAIFGWSRQEAVGQVLANLIIPERFREAHRHAVERCLQVREGMILNRQMETTALHRDGHEFPIELSVSAGNSGGRIVFNAFVRDITERKRAEEELHRANEELQQHIEYIQKTQEQLIRAEKMASVGLLTSGVSHEIMNPLNIITMRTYMMLNSPDTPPEVARQLKIIEEQAARIVKITQDLLYYARQRPPERRRLELNDVVTRTLGLVEYDLKKINIDIYLDLSEQLPPVVADEDQLQQVILNLITNARDAMPEGGKLTVYTGVKRKNGQQCVELQVEDTGVGIFPEHKEKLFDPFFTTKPEGKGTGLGLSICHGIVAGHGGSIWAKSEEGMRTTFIVQIPLEQAKKEVPPD